MSCVRVPRHVTRLVVDFFAYAARPGASTHRVARRRLLRLRRASRCLGTSHGSSRGSSRRSLSTTSPKPRVSGVSGASARRAARDAARRRLLRLRRASGCLDTSRGSLSTSSPTSRVRVPRHVARLVIDYFAYTVRPGASAPRTAHRAARRTARRRLLRLRRASRCLGTSRGLSRGSSSTTSPTPGVRVPRHVARLIVDYFDYAAHPGASAHRAARHAARRTARCRLHCLRRASGCLGMSRGSSSTTSSTLCVQVPRHLAWLIARLVAPLVVDYSI
jgi:hypothetical protein